MVLTQVAIFVGIQHIEAPLPTKDAGFAEEAANLAKPQVWTQVDFAILAQANSLSRAP